MNLSLIDTHAHLQHPRYAEDLEAVLERAAEAHVTSVIVPGTQVSDSESAVLLAERHDGGPCRLYAAVGIHPTEALNVSQGDLDKLRALARSPHVVAIGEIGLDYYWPRVEDRKWPCPSPEVQRGAFKAQLALAAELDLPVIIHDREAHEDVYRILVAWKAAHPRAKGTLHAYAAGPDMLSAFLELGFSIGLDGPLTYKKASRLQEVAAKAPLDRILLETDAPYLTPSPHRGKRNEPSYLWLVAEALARIRTTSIAEIAANTTLNASLLFGL
ncbi:MAG TPA: TatD family deoxyribonuclease [Chloroflexi bacterium]|nr:TatD family deoxyribonuclease [Chloroflexota bacterium]